MRDVAGQLSAPETKRLLCMLAFLITPYFVVTHFSIAVSVVISADIMTFFLS